MRLRHAIPALVVVILAACSGTSTSTSSSGTPSSGTPSSANPSTPAGQVDCDAIDTAAQQLFAVQLLAQLTTPDNVAAIRDQQIGNLDLDAFLAGMDDLHVLDAYSSPLGDPKAAIDLYEEAGRGAQVLFANDPITQAQIDTYNTEFVGTIPEFLSHQIAISGAVGEAGC